MINGLKGKIFDETTKTIPSVLVYVSDADGKIISDKARVVSDLNGNYEVPVAIPMFDPLVKGKINLLKIGSHVTFIGGGFRKIFPIDFNGTGVKTMDVQIFPKEKLLEEITVTGNQQQYFCEKKGGVWDFKSQSCKLPEPEPKPKPDKKEKTMKEKWNSLSKTKKTLIIAAGSVAVLGIIVLIVKASK